MKKIVISLGGSLIVPDEIQVDFLRQFQELILSKTDQYTFVIFAGGGSIARRYMAGGKEVADLSSDQLDWLGIHASRLNAQLLRMIFDKAAEDEIIVDPTKKIVMNKPITIGAGWKPGWSTDYDAVQTAVSNDIDQVINLSNIKYVYNKDPKKYHDAEPIKEMNWKDFRNLVGDAWTPGLSMPFDPIAAKLAEKNEIEVIIADGINIENLEAILAGEEFIGTRISG